MTERMISAPYVLPEEEPGPRCSDGLHKVWHVDAECDNQPEPPAPTVVVAQKDCGCG